MFIGKTGYGKSSTINFIVGEDILRTSDIQACTKRLYSIEYRLPVWFSYDEFLGTYLLVYDDRYDKSTEVSGGDSFTTYGMFLGLSEDGMPVILARYIGDGRGLDIDSQEVRSRVDYDFLNACELYTADQIDSDATLKGMPTYGFGNILYKEFANGANAAEGYEYVVDAGIENQPSFIATTTENFDVGDIIVVWGFLGERLGGSYGRCYLDTYGAVKYVPGEVLVMSPVKEESQVGEIEAYVEETGITDFYNAELRGMTKEELRLARNEIYA